MKQKWLTFVTEFNKRRLDGKVGYVVLGGSWLKRASSLLKNAKPVLCLHATRILQIAWVKK